MSGKLLHYDDVKYMHTYLHMYIYIDQYIYIYIDLNIFSDHFIRHLVIFTGSHDVHK